MCFNQKREETLDTPINTISWNETDPIAFKLNRSCKTIKFC